MKNTKKFLELINVDIFIFSGGDNVGDDPTRDNTEKKMLEFAIKNKIPSFGVCRGMQFFNHYFGGKIRHSSDKSHVKTRHKIKLLIISCKNSYTENQVLLIHFMKIY